MLNSAMLEPEPSLDPRRRRIVPAPRPSPLPPAPAHVPPPRLVRYLASLNTAQRVLWCYLLWYLVVLVEHFDPSPALWLSSLGLSAIIGTALYLSTASAGRSKTQLERWQVARFFIMPFCVSSFAALIKGQGFVLIFHPTWEGNAIGVGACAGFLGAVALLKHAVRTDG